MNFLNKNLTNPSSIAFNGSVSTAKVLLAKGADIEAEDEKKSRPLHLAVTGNNRLMAEMLLQKGVSLQPSNTDGSTPLHLAAASNNVKIMELLLNKGADTDAKDAHGTTALHLAAGTNNPQTAQLLVDRGAVKGARDNDESTPLHWAAFGNKCGHVHSMNGGFCAQNVVPNGHKFPVVNQIKTMEILLDQGVGIGVRNTYGYTALHLAAFGNSVEAMRLLLDRGAVEPVSDRLTNTTKLPCTTRFSRIRRPSSTC